MLLQVPCWASSDPNKDCAQGQWNDAYPPSSLADYAAAFQKLVQLYGDRVSTWEVWNEPNISRFWAPAPNAAAYTQLLQLSYAAIKGQQPAATVLGGSLAGADLPFLDAMYAAGAAGYFDALALHPYSTGSPDSCLDTQRSFRCGVPAVRSLMSYHGNPKPIWITEFGWSTYGGGNGVSEATQRQYLEQALAMVETWQDVPVATWYTLVDPEFNYPGMPQEDYFGLYDGQHRPKPSASWLRESRFPFQVYVPLLRKY
jgi:hypothetical protein